MVFRLTWLASFSLLALVILRLTRLFLPSESGLPWQVVVVVAAALGATVTWAATKARLGPTGLIVGHIMLFLVFGYLYLGGELSDTPLPPLEVLNDIPSELSAGLTIFRYSAPPVAPLAGVVVLSTLMVWALAAVATWGLLNNSPYLGIVPPVVFYLQLAVIDRQTTGMLWTTTLLLLVGGGLAAIAADQKAGGGHAGHGRQRAQLQAVLVPVLAIAAVTAVSVLGTRQAVEADVVPAGGVLDWTNRSGIGGGFGSVSYTPFIDVHRSLVSNSETPAFSATLTGDVPPGQIYWRLLTMDSYNAEGGFWFASRDELEDLEETSWEADEFEFRGATVPVIQQVRISNLSSAWLPAAYSPVSIFSEKRLIQNTTRVDPIDGSLHIDGVTGRNMTYSIQSLVPVVDSGVLAADASGESLSPLFAAAAGDGLFQPVPTPAPDLIEPADLDQYRDLPRDADPTGGLRELAERLTLGLETDYEKALALEHFFRDPQLFRYSTTIAPEDRESGLTEWLLVGDSPGHREGYCEQFSASMGVLARLLDIPTRTVLGFTPGEVQEEDGSILVRDKNAHAWVEVWLDAQGWVRFDPTPRGDGVNPTTFQETGLLPVQLEQYFSQLEEAALAAQGASGGGGDPAVRSPNFDTERFAGGGGSAPTTDGGGFSLPSWATQAAFWLAVAVVALGTVPAIKRRRRRRRIRRFEDGDVAAAWAEIVDRLIDSGVGVSQADTPDEVAISTDAAMHPLAEAYGEVVYSAGKEVASETHQAAVASLTATEKSLRSRESGWQRLRRIYRVRSLLPDWIKRIRKR